MSKFQYRIANEADEIQLRYIMQSNPMEGQIKMTFQREPNYFRAAGIGSKFNQTIVACDDATNDIVAMGSRSVKPVFINGKVENIGYLSSLRIKENYRRNSILARGYKFLKELHKDGKTKYYLSTILQNNTTALNILTKGRGDLPIYHNIGTYYTYIITTGKKKRKINRNISISKGASTSQEEIICYLHRRGKEKQFFPYITKDDFNHENSYLKNLNINDFYIAKKNNKIVGLLARWDQSPYKQITITDYNKKISILKPFYNSVANILSYPRLPEKDKRIKYFYASFVVIDNDDPDIFSSLLNTLHNDSMHKKDTYIMIGLCANDPLRIAFKKYKHIKYASEIFLVHWPNESNIAMSIDTKMLYLEIGAL
jgi:hypothetical protein